MGEVFTGQGFLDGIGRKFLGGNGGPPRKEDPVLSESELGERVGVIDEKVDKQAIRKSGMRAKKKRPVSRSLLRL